jgi:hypothetical protein
MHFRSGVMKADFKPRFSGHETFPFRYDWLRKFLTGPDRTPLGEWQTQSALEREMIAFGVGKNMVRSMRYWAQATKAVDIRDGRAELTSFGRILLEKDPYLDFIGTIWAVHWRIATNAEDATTWYWLFNLYPSVVVNVRTAADELKKFASMRGWRVVSDNTLRRDVECFLRCYSVERGRKGELTEDSMECPLAELELLRPQADRRMLEFQRGPKPSLPDAVFAFALNEFWLALTEANTLSLDQIAHSPGSPGRVFCLDENSLLERLDRIEAATDGAFRWIDTAGLQQVTRVRGVENSEALLSHIYEGANA